MNGITENTNLFLLLFLWFAVLVNLWLQLKVEKSTVNIVSVRALNCIKTCPKRKQISPVSQWKDCSKENGWYMILDWRHAEALQAIDIFSHLSPTSSSLVSSSSLPLGSFPLFPCGWINIATSKLIEGIARRWRKRDWEDPVSCLQRQSYRSASHASV